MHRLPPHAAALLCAAALLALGAFLFGIAPFAALCVAALAVGAGLALCPSARGRALGATAALALAGAAVGLALVDRAEAAEFSASGLFLVVPWGDLAIEAAKFALALIVPSAIGWISVEVARLFPALNKQRTDACIDRMMNFAADFALAALEGCAKGQTVPVNMRAASVAAVAARALNSSPAWQVAAAGGAQGIAEKAFRTLPLDPGATAENTLAPALEMLGVKPAA